jgi:hypothetical protein
LIELVLRRVGVEVEAQADFSTSHRRVFQAMAVPSSVPLARSVITAVCGSLLIASSIKR